MSSSSPSLLLSSIYIFDSCVFIYDFICCAVKLTLACVANTPPSTLSTSIWREPLASSFRVRGATYLTDKVKVTSAPYLFQLVAVDLFEVPGPTMNICSHPKNRVYKALQRGDDAWIYAVNIMVPGPPYISFVAYFKGDRVTTHSLTLSSSLG